MSTASSSPSGRSSLHVPPPPYSPGLNPLSASQGQGTIYPSWSSLDPRSSSTQSLTPSESGHVGPDARRTLLLVYIHGFMGNDSSFRSFPAHVHNYVKQELFDTHAIHSKIYPRYKTYKSIEVARDNFSAWLEPHQSETTDVILVGHSMGGLLAADIVLIPNNNPASSYPFKHRILGTISLDSPFLGLHPGIIISGIASLFRPSPSVESEGPASQGIATSPDPSRSLSPDPSLYSELSPQLSPTSPLTLSDMTSSTSLNTVASDPGFNPPFWNDVQFKDRGWLRNVAHFAKKHKQENLFEATADHIMSHLEFGGCLADYPKLNSRYEKLRRLEDVDDLHANPAAAGKPKEARVRFVNYFTISTGRTKNPKPQTAPRAVAASPHLKPEPAEGRKSGESSRTSTPRISIEDRSDQERPMLLEEIDPVPEPPSPPLEAVGSEETKDSQAAPASASASASEPKSPDTPLDRTPSLPAIPPLPERPVAPDLDSFPDADSRKQAEKEAKRAQKAYDQAVKDRDKAVKERQKLVEKMRLKAAKEAAKKEKEERKQLEKEEQALKKEAERVAKEAAAAPGSLSPGGPPRSPTGEEKKEKKKKERKFCMLPRSVKEHRDNTWIRVYMEGVDEVGAHCGLFIPNGPHYEKLIGDVGFLIVQWVQEDANRRAIQSLE